MATALDTTQLIRLLILSVLDISLVEDQNHGKLCLVKNRAGVKHVGHERRSGRSSRGINNISDNSRERRRKRLEENSSGGGPNKDFDLSRCIDQNSINGFAIGLLGIGLGALLKQVDDLIDLCSEEVKRSQDSTVGAKVVLLHDLFVVDRVADIDVGLERHRQYSRIEIDDIWRSIVLV
ncbi:hypothetical protein HG531_000687 [Fusarium graminearum]|nr:hypothetical protein HG531_000687 [Fusarium graminearum]